MANLAAMRLFLAGLALVASTSHLSLADCDITSMTSKCYSDVGLSQPTLMIGEPSEAYTINAILDLTLISSFCNKSDAFRAALSCQVSAALACLYQGTPAPGAVDMSSLMPDPTRVADPTTVDLVCKYVAKWNEQCAIQQMEQYSMCQMQQIQQLSETNTTLEEDDKKDYTCAVYRSMRDCAKTVFHACGCAAESMVTYFVGYAMYPVSCGVPSSYDVGCMDLGSNYASVNAPHILAIYAISALFYLLR